MWFKYACFWSALQNCQKFNDFLLFPTHYMTCYMHITNLIWMHSYGVVVPSLFIDESVPSGLFIDIVRWKEVSLFKTVRFNNKVHSMSFEQDHVQLRCERTNLIRSWPNTTIILSGGELSILCNIIHPITAIRTRQVSEPPAINECSRNAFTFDQTMLYCLGITNLHRLP